MHKKSNFWENSHLVSATHPESHRVSYWYENISKVLLYSKNRIWNKY